MGEKSFKIGDIVEHVSGEGQKTNPHMAIVGWRTLSKDEQVQDGMDEECWADFVYVCTWLDKKRHVQCSTFRPATLVGAYK